MPCTGEPPLGLVARSYTFSEALGKRAKTGHPVYAPMVPLDEGPVEDGFQRGLLAEWMKLAVQHAPPMRQGRHRRPVPGGLQDTYVHAIRRHLTEASLACQGAQAEAMRDAEAVATSEAPPAADAVGILVAAEPRAPGCLLLDVRAVHDGLEGAVVCGVVSEGTTTLQLVTEGGAVRLLLHRRHPALQACGEAALRPGTRLRVRGFRTIGASSGRRGPLLLPVEVLVLARFGMVPIAGPKEEESMPLAWECLGVTP